MKKLFPLIFLILLLGSYQLLLQLPYDFYQEALTHGVKSDFLELRKLPPSYYKGGRYVFSKMEGLASEEERLWERLHFDNFLMPFPIKHPQFMVVPKIEREAGEYSFGFKILNYKKEELNTVSIKADQEFSLDFQEHKIFQLPLFKKRITMNGLSGPWIDLFLRDYSKNRYPAPELGKIWNPFEIPMVHMVYDLFILKSRERFFPTDMTSISYWEEKDFGIAEVVDQETKEDRPKLFREEYIFVLNENRVYRIHLRTRLEDFSAERYRQKFLKSLSYKAGHEDSSISLYSSYKKLDYSDKMSPTGLTYLYAGLSHKKKSRQFLREMIQFLERGKNDRVYLEPLYKYAYEIFGSSFSNEMKNLKESQSEKLQRKILEEAEAESIKLKREEFVDQQDFFISDEAKINFYLQKAKDSGEDTSANKNSVIMD